MTSLTDFGRYLRHQRELRGLTVEDVVRSTKIPPTLVQALEDGQGERFPERVFVLNYVRSYANVVGLSAEDVASRYDSLPEAGRVAAVDHALAEQNRRERALTIAWGVAAVTLLMILSVGLLQFSSQVARYVHR